MRIDLLPRFAGNEMLDCVDIRTETFRVLADRLLWDQKDEEKVEGKNAFLRACAQTTKVGRNSLQKRIC